MKIPALLFTALTVTSASAFTPAVKPQVVSATSLHMGGWFFEKGAFHGGGSAKDEDLDEQWATQQAILDARRGHDGPNKEHLHDKYEHGGPKHFELGGSKPMLHDNPALDAPGHVDIEQKAKQTKKFKFFWEK